MLIDHDAVVAERLEAASVEFLCEKSLSRTEGVCGIHDDNVVLICAAAYELHAVLVEYIDSRIIGRPLHYRSPDGIDIFVGKNNLQNERLLRTSDLNAIWLHAKDTPASHVILCTEKPSRETLYLAAVIAAYHSSVSASENVPIDYTQVRYVKKPSGARPGFVNYFHQHTLYVTPSLEEIAPYRVEENK